jgi:hypothetical protein
MRSISTMILGALFLLFGGVSIWDAQRIASTIRRRGTLDLIGPDGYLNGAAGLLIVGVLLLVQGVLEWRRSRASVSRAMRAASIATNDGDSTSTTGRHLALLGVLVAYAVLLPVIGYAIATLAALMALFRIMGVSGWWRILAWSIGVTVVFHVGFVVIADLPLPKGLLKLG